MKKTIITAISSRDMRVNVNPVFVRGNGVRRLCGSPAKREVCIVKLRHPALKVTLHWMLSKNV